MEKLLTHPTKSKSHLIPILIFSIGIILISYLISIEFNHNYSSQQLKAQLFYKNLNQSNNQLNNLIKISQNTSDQIRYKS